MLGKLLFVFRTLVLLAPIIGCLKKNGTQQHCNFKFDRVWESFLG